MFSVKKNKYRLGIKEVVPMIESSKMVGFKVIQTRLCAEAV